MPVHAAGPGRLIAEQPVHRHAPVNEPDPAAEPQQQRPGIVGKAVGRGRPVEVRRLNNDLPPGHQGTGVISVDGPVDYVFVKHLMVAPAGDQQLVRPAAVAVVQRGVVHAGAVVRVALQKVHLPLQLALVRPVVVPLTEGEVFPPGIGVENILVDIADALGKLILLLVKGADDLRVLFFVLPDNGRRAVGGGVVVHQHLKGEAGFLAYKALQRGTDVLLVVIGRAKDGNKAVVLVHGCSFSIQTYKFILLYSESPCISTKR